MRGGGGRPRQQASQQCHTTTNNREGNKRWRHLLRGRGRSPVNTKTNQARWAYMMEKQEVEEAPAEGFSKAERAADKRSCG